MDGLEDDSDIFLPFASLRDKRLDVLVTAYHLHIESLLEKYMELRFGENLELLDHLDLRFDDKKKILEKDDLVSEEVIEDIGRLNRLRNILVHNLEFGQDEKNAIKSKISSFNCQDQDSDLYSENLIHKQNKLAERFSEHKAILLNAYHSIWMTIANRLYREFDLSYEDLMNIHNKDQENN